MWLNQYVGHAGLLFKLEPKYQSFWVERIDQVCIKNHLLIGFFALAGFIFRYSKILATFMVVKF